MSPLTGKKVKSSNNSTICDHLLHRNFLPSLDKFNVLAHENEKYSLEIKESLLIMKEIGTLILHLCTYLIKSLNKFSLISRKFI